VNVTVTRMHVQSYEDTFTQNVFMNGFQLSEDRLKRQTTKDDAQL
jgi:hypothetical protein